MDDFCVCKLTGCAGAVSVLWLPLRAYTFLIRSGGAQVSASPLADSALLLTLALLHHAPAPELGQGNPFRQAFASMQVGHAHDTTAPPPISAQASPVQLPLKGCSCQDHSQGHPILPARPSMLHSLPFCMNL